MTWPRLITVSIAVNVALLGVVGMILWSPASGFFSWFTLPGSSRKQPASEPTIITNIVTQIAVRKVSPTNFWAALLASKSPSWGLVESTNYVTYIENLRSIGCPEETIKDIIIADVAKLYGKRRAALRAMEKAEPFWKSDDSSNTPEKEALRLQLQALDQEEKALVEKLLGVDLDTELSKYSEGVAAATEDSFSYLPEDKRSRVSDLQREFEEAEAAIYRNAKGLVLDEDKEQIRRLEIKKEEELAKVLTPQELEEYQLRTSTTANNLRSQLAGFGANEEEFRKLFRLQKTFDDQFSNAFDTTDERQIAIRARAEEQAQQALNEEIKNALGDKRFAEYQRAQDSDYQMLLQFSDRFAVSRDVATKVYDMKQEAERQKAAVESNPNLTSERRQAALAALAQETRRSIAQTMGGNDSKIWNVYKRNGGEWIDNLKQSELPDTEPMVPTEVPIQQTPPFPPFPPFPIPIPPP